MPDEKHETEPATRIAIQTLVAAGYTIEGNHRQPRHTEIRCRRTDILGAQILYLVMLTDNEAYTCDQINDIRYSAESQNRIPVLIARVTGNGWISWEDFTEALGGAVPSWQALSDNYGVSLKTAAQNKLPDGMTGEAWLIFEDLVGYGLEFILGRRVRRLGGRVRGRRVSDVQAQTPQERIVIVDAKASESGFDVNWPALRPLVEYVNKQRERQKGHMELLCALLVSSGFQQDDARLLELSQEFMGETRFPLAFMDVSALSEVVDLFRNRPDVRNGIRWNQVLRGGRVLCSAVKHEIDAVDAERIKKG